MPVYPLAARNARCASPGCWGRDRSARYPSDLDDSQWRVLEPEARAVMAELTRASGLLADAYQAHASALAAAVDARPPGDHAGRWAALCHAYRDWSLSSPAEFALTHGTPVPGYQAPAQVTGPAAARTITIALGVYAAAVAAEAADPARSPVPAGLQTGPLWEALLAGQAHDHEPRLAGIILTAWASIIGYLSAEIFGSLAQLVADTGSLYHAHIRNVMLSMGYNPGGLAECRPFETGGGGVRRLFDGR